MAYGVTRSLCCSAIWMKLCGVLRWQVVVYGSEFRPIQLSCVLLTSQFEERWKLYNPSQSAVRLLTDKLNCWRKVVCRRLSHWTVPKAGITCSEMWRCLSRYLVPDVSRQPVVSFSGVLKAHLQTLNQKGSYNCFCLNLPIYHPKLIVHILRNWSQLIIRRFLQNIEII